MEDAGVGGPTLEGEHHGGPLEEEVGLDISHHRGTAYDLEPAKTSDVEELMEIRASRHGKVEVPKEKTDEA